jgi:flagellar biosynthesis chaperone FliJ
MNNPRRKALEKIAVKIEELQNELKEIMDEEEEYRDNMPENLQGSERYEIADEACNAMQTAIDSLGEAMASIEEAQQ